MVKMASERETEPYPGYQASDMCSLLPRYTHWFSNCLLAILVLVRQ